MTTKSLQARQARAGTPRRRGGGAGIVVVAAALAIAAPGLVNLLRQAPGPLPVAEPAMVAAPSVPAGRTDRSAAPVPSAPATAPRQTAAQDAARVPMPPRSYTPWRPVKVARATGQGGDAIGELDFPPRMSSRDASGGWFGARGASAGAEARPTLATRLALPRADLAPPREVSGAVLCPGAIGCARSPAPVPQAAQARDITAALFPNGQVRPVAPVPVPPAAPEGRDITARLFPSGVARW